MFLMGKQVRRTALQTVGVENCAGLCYNLRNYVSSVYHLHLFAPTFSIAAVIAFVPIPKVWDKAFFAKVSPCMITAIF